MPAAPPHSAVTKTGVLTAATLSAGTTACGVRINVRHTYSYERKAPKKMALKGTSRANKGPQPAKKPDTPLDLYTSRATESMEMRAAASMVPVAEDDAAVR